MTSNKVILVSNMHSDSCGNRQVMLAVWNTVAFSRSASGLKTQNITPVCNQTNCHINTSDDIK